MSLFYEAKLFTNGDDMAHAIFPSHPGGLNLPQVRLCASKFMLLPPLCDLCG